MNKFDKTVNRYLKEAVQPNGPVTNANGDKVWYKDGKLHRLDGPAVDRADGAKEWYKDDKLHRLDGPAVERTNGDKLWYINDKQLTEKEFNEYIKKQEIKKEIQGHKNNRIDPDMLEDYL